jgi:PAS domain S-box-containing protein
VKVIDTLEAVGERIQFAMIIGTVPVDGSGHIELLYANAPAASLFGFPGGKAMKGMDVRDLMPESYSRDHKARVSDYVSRANGGHRLASGIMGSWRSLEGKRRDGSLVPVYANVADIRNSEERYFLAVFKDRTKDQEREESLKEAVQRAELLAQEAEEAKQQAEDARASAEDSLLRQKRLSGQISLLRQIFMGTIMLVVMLGVLVVAQWVAGITDPDGLAMVERVLLVLTGILGSAMASVFDSRNRVGD